MLTGLPITFSGWAEDEMQPGQWKDYYYPNYETGRAMWYHDHADGVTSVNAYFGQAGGYIIHDPAEDSLGLPSGKYDVPLSITDKIYQSNGDLVSPASETIDFLGDIIHVNGQPWPYMAVEPRKYRFRIYDMSLSRPYDLYFEDPAAYMMNFQIIASDSGLFGNPVTTSDVLISMGERYEVVVDFAPYAGKNVTMKNKLQIPVVDEYENTDKVMMFIVGTLVSDSSNNGAVPSTLNSAISWPAPRDIVDHTFAFQRGGDNIWTINGIDFADVNNRVLAKPAQGAVELWELQHTSGQTVHPVHIHLVNMQVISRTGGSRGVLPYESAGLKDTVLLEPGETVKVLAYYGPWEGIYMFHCHNLIHEDHAMMAAMDITLLEALGYDVNTTGYADPTDPRFAPQDYSAEAFSLDAEGAAVVSLANMNPYGDVTAAISAQKAHYATASSPGEATTTVAPVSPAQTTGPPTTLQTAQPVATPITGGRPAGRPRQGPPKRRTVFEA
jgi:FtsP/CotA-like multicopper oxidase with cupredoxin domain